MDQRTRESSLCDGFTDYMLGEGTEVERKRFERHLEECPSCRADAAVWEETWGELYRDMDELEPPADLKRQVLDALEKADAPAQPAAADRNGSAPRRRSARPVWRQTAVAAALALAFFAGWQGRAELRPAPQAAPALPAVDRIESVFHLVAAQSDGGPAISAQAYGLACIVDSSSERQKELIVYLFGAPQTQGSEAYQVWLWNDGTRSSAGSIQVENAGVGILTMPLQADAAPIQSIGVTLEPSGYSAAPQGPKVFGSAPDDPGWKI